MAKAWLKHGQNMARALPTHAKASSKHAQSKLKTTPEHVQAKHAHSKASLEHALSMPTVEQFQIESFGNDQSMLGAWFGILGASFCMLRACSGHAQGMLKACSRHAQGMK